MSVPSTGNPLDRPTERQFVRVLPLQHCRKEDPFMVGRLLDGLTPTMEIFRQPRFVLGVTLLRAGITPVPHAAKRVSC